ncbi:Basic-leucine zipper domain-containing protein [Strongyloides ratti]|uniref:Basic-leucine zipper domain-containing protein n=1 Tax=Strongyloides ratti TaxID=34506 RepID=A0A090L5J5_STRRB|nr:Basic-leucine zipper domain-containing protein [Strongyloides ratti]CEF63387.1 Basic-leucine zipper domain-containing protein [Strongyloides ratti]
MSATFENTLFAQQQVEDFQGLSMIQDNDYLYLSDSVDDLPPSSEESQSSFGASPLLEENSCTAVAHDILSSLRRTTASKTCETWVWPKSTASAFEISYCSCCGPLFVVDPKCNSILSSNKAIENDSNLDLHLNNSYNSIEYNHNSPTSSYYTSSISSLQYSSSDNGYNSCTESTFSLSPLPINQFEWIDNLIYEARNEIENEKTIMVKKYIKRKNHSTKVSSLMTDVTELKNSKKHSLSGMNYTEKARRKKEQNRIAAQRYRIKQKATEKAESEEMKYLKDRNAFLRAESARLEKEIEEVKNMMLVFMR